jgi:hypothetical protein
MESQKPDDNLVFDVEHTLSQGKKAPLKGGSYDGDRYT